MPARIIQRNSKAFRKVKVDTVTIDIIESALRNARYEMDTVLFRTAMSPGIREQHNEFPMIANVEGKMVVGQFGSFIWGFMQGYDGTVEEGDVFLTNDPDGSLEPLKSYEQQVLAAKQNCPECVLTAGLLRACVPAENQRLWQFMTAFARVKIKMELARGKAKQLFYNPEPPRKKIHDRETARALRQ